MKTINKLKKVILENNMNNIEYNFNDFISTIKDYYMYGKNLELLGTGKTYINSYDVEKKIAKLFDVDYSCTENIESSLFGLANEYAQYVSFTQTHDLNIVYFHF